MVKRKCVDLESLILEEHNYALKPKRIKRNIPHHSPKPVAHIDINHHDNEKEDVEIDLFENLRVPEQTTECGELCYFVQVRKYCTYQALLDGSEDTYSAYLQMNDYKNIQHPRDLPDTIDYLLPREMRDQMKSESKILRSRLQYLDEYERFLTAPLKKIPS